MRLSYLVAAAAAAFFAVSAPAMAATVLSGNVDAQYTHISSDPGGNDANAWGIGGAFAAPLGSGNWGLQLDGSWTNVDPDHGDNTNLFAGTAHVFYRNDTNAIGGAVGAVHDDNFSTTTWGVALQDDYYFSNTTVGANVVYAKNDDDDVDFWGVEGHARYFFQDNLSLEGSVGFGSVDFNPGNDDAWEAGLNAEYQFASAPVSIFGGVNYLHLDSSPDFHSTAAQVGVRWNFGGQTLKDRDRSGASLKGIDSAFSGGLAGVF